VTETALAVKATWYIVVWPTAIHDCNWSRYGHVQFSITGCWNTRRASHVHPNASLTLQFNS